MHRRFARLIALLAVSAFPGAAAAQTCPAAQFRCPGSYSQSCGSDSGGEITRTVTCNSSGTLTSCTISSADGRSCNCGTTGQCTLSAAPAACNKRCGSTCLDGLDAVCCGTQAYEAGAVCCGSQGYVPGTVCCGTQGYEPGAVCCSDFACKSGLECCNDGIRACRQPGTSCCQGDLSKACPSGSDCVDTTCCPRLTPQSSAFASYDSSTGYCCGDQTCVQNGTCQGGAGLCACANPCAGSCCPSGKQCCPNRGWCATTTAGCPTCPASNPVMCDDGTCAPSGSTCCGARTYCPNGQTCRLCTPEGTSQCCVGGSEALPSTTAVSPPGGGAAPSTPYALANGSAQTAPNSGKASLGATGAAPGAAGCGGGTSGGGPDGGSGGRGLKWGCNGSGLAFNFLAFAALLRTLGARGRRRR